MMINFVIYFLEILEKQEFWLYKFHLELKQWIDNNSETVVD